LKIFKDEGELIDACLKLFDSIAIHMGRNVYVGGLEIDLIAVVPDILRPSVHVFEVKRRPKLKLLKQLSTRVLISDYVYVVLPYTAYSWAFTYVPDYVGVVIVDRFLNPHIIRLPKWLGNGSVLLDLILKR
jgi:hypothetical protein